MVRLCLTDTTGTQITQKPKTVNQTLRNTWRVALHDIALGCVELHDLHDTIANTIGVFTNGVPAANSKC